MQSCSHAPSAATQVAFQERWELVSPCTLIGCHAVPPNGAGTAGSSHSLSHWYCICMPSLSNPVTLTVCSRLSSFTWRTLTTLYNAGKSEACSSRLRARADTSAI
ncbi:unnamed protein product [Vitrella brassicaformis CCMP3155]|uniref:Uncharacterized protein n=1 Tax=Vitrella brassicaformis (strain CCMP3155) TaxID=1169540 RepID=A0A0G4GCQ1_VITBC|nr:unnamed protein product [Vitrella brassicaformis CCMP3155]|eukprot:CEM26577.1 unnamed protein product [Vitrella brassicaformis CCMP3155]